MALLSSTTVAGSLAVSGTIYQNGTAVSLVGHTHTKAQITDFPTLATVATSGSYNDLSNKPTIPAAVTVDAALNSTSTNPVQNKVVTSALTVLDSLPSSGDYDGQIVFIKVV